jgi:alpha-tubulin suppressor-like RCC1 family protein
MHRIFSCGNGSTFALGHKNRESCSTFKQIEFFNGNEDGVSNVGVKTIACGLSHSGCVLADGSVYLWGITGDIQYSKEFMDKCLIKKPTKISFRGSPDANNGNVSHRRRSNAADEQGNVVVEDIKLGE